MAPQWAVSPAGAHKKLAEYNPFAFFKAKAKGSKVGSSLNGFLQAEDVEIIQLEWDLTETAAADFISIILLSFCFIVFWYELEDSQAKQIPSFGNKM